MLITLSLLRLSLQVSVLVLHLFFELLDLLLALSKDLADLGVQVVLLLSENLLELFLILSLLKVNSLELSFEVGLSFAHRLSQSLLLRLQLCDVLSQVFSFPFNLGDLFLSLVGGLGLLLGQISAGRLERSLCLLELLPELDCLTCSKVFGVEKLNLVDLRACHLPFELFKLLLQ